MSDANSVEETIIATSELTLCTPEEKVGQVLERERLKVKEEINHLILLKKKEEKKMNPNQILNKKACKTFFSKPLKFQNSQKLQPEELDNLQKVLKSQNLEGTKETKIIFWNPFQ